MSKEEKKKPLWSRILNIIIYIILAMVLVVMLFVNLSKKDNELTVVFGYSLAVIQSGSMVAGGFNVGDMVLIKKVQPETIRKGDIIVFYQAGTDYVDSTLTLTNVTQILENNEPLPESTPIPQYIEENRTTREDAIDNKCILVFHRVMEIYVDEFGTLFYQTKGDSNGSADTDLVREDLIEGRYVYIPAFISAIFNFIISPLGLVIVIVIPLTILFIQQLIDYIRQIRNYLRKNKLLAGTLTIDNVKTNSLDLNKMLTFSEKVYLYDTALPQYKNTLANKMWTEDEIKKVNAVYEKDRELYYVYWMQKCDKKDLEEFRVCRIQADLVKFKKLDFNEASKQAIKIYKEKLKHGNNN